ncbi:hypothetical protein [Bacillus cereus]|uniref:hypothetical protein n=1 Tax=Bacillus cereus TaxID=1396 RepID=UPI000BF3F6BE|nr:hypothetical protein [Bacillus cereus]PEX25437.1 hypothetical protein CN458_18085 [Bacillus cereus]
MEQVDVVYALIYDNTNRKILMVGVPPAFRKKHAKSMQDFMQKNGRHRERWGGQKARQNRNV